MKVRVRTFLLLGSNMGDRQVMLQAARVRLEILAGPIAATSKVYETAAWGKTDQPGYLNQVIALDTALEPRVLLSTILAIEQSLGRVRKEKWEPRPIDIDILLYGESVINEPDLVVPHPAMPERRFALTPLAEIAGELVHPVLKMSINQLLSECSDPLEVKLPEARG